jgi:hypoxanthine phosphoribosyltransferase
MIDTVKKQRFSWKEFDDAIEFIAQNLTKIRKKPIIGVFGIPRGGLVPAVALSHRLDVPLVTKSNGEDGYIVIIDDISDTGTTFKKIKSSRDFCHGLLLTASIHYKPTSSFKPDVYYQEINNWIIYSWENEKTSRVDYKKDDTPPASVILKNTELLLQD